MKRSKCPITNLLDIVGDKWTLLIVRDLLLGSSRYTDFAVAPEQIPTNILADRLRRMEDWGLLERRAYQTNPVRYEYKLTPKGRDLGPVLNEMKKWGLRHVKGAQAFAVTSAAEEPRAEARARTKSWP